MMMPDDTTHELQMKIANYKRTRETVAPSMRPWCDMLISKAEDELRQIKTSVGLSNWWLCRPLPTELLGFVGQLDVGGCQQLIHPSAAAVNAARIGPTATVSAASRSRPWSSPTRWAASLRASKS
jgi:hypothetical protein